MSEQQPLHQAFALSWLDLLQGTNVRVEPEMDLSHKKQFIDMVLIRSDSGPIPRPLPDGFEELAPHNLVSFKSKQETLDGWALCELIGHYVNYRKQSSPSMQDLLPEEDYRLFAVCVRTPHNLLRQGVMRLIRPGVHEVVFLGVAIRIIVVHQLPQEEHNAMLLLFSAQDELRQYARGHYRTRTPDISTLLQKVLEAYDEGSEMAIKLYDLVRMSTEELLANLPPEDLLRHLKPEVIRKHLSPKDFLEGLPPEKMFEALSPEQMRALLEVAQQRVQTDNPPTPPQ